MKASVRWLRELCPHLPDDAKAIAERLTAAGLEVEGSEEFGRAADSCVVASVVSTRPHPSRSGLRLVTVDQGKSQLELVCGAPNVPDAGGLVVLAPLGAHLPAKGMTIERRSIAGVESEGMLCSEAELGLGDDPSGLLVLPPATARAGARLADALPAARDTVLEIALTPNRPDGLGHLGLAREAAALFGVPFAPPAPKDPPRTRESALAEFVSVAVEDGERCPIYAGAVLLDVRVAPSPLEIRWRLASLGVRAISNVVDVTNLVMLEFAHPMHAFDLDKVRSGAIVVRRARARERLRTLDGVERELSPDDLVICDGGGPTALAGIMGGGDSEITPTTERVFLECAYFDPPGIRRSARRHALHTESSHRFERGVDWGDVRVVLARAAASISTLAGATAITPARVVEAKPLSRRTVALRQERLRALLGTAVAHEDTIRVLKRLGFTRRGSDSAADLWEAPSFRPDVSREVDLIEEVGRVRGYDAIPTTLPRVRASRDAGPRQAIARRAREAAVAAGLSEAVTHAFVSPRELEAVGAPSATVKLLNPLTDERSVMRTSLLPGLLRVLEQARRHGERDARLFTVGALFLSAGASLPDERLGLTVVVAGERKAWLSKPERVDVWDAKGIAEDLVFRLLRRQTSVLFARENERPKALHPRGAAWILADGARIGHLGPLHPDVADTFEIDDTPMVVEIDLAAAHALGPSPLRFEALPRFPAVARDLAIVVRDEVPAGEVEQAAREVAAGMAERVTLFDRFVGGSIPAGHASLALHVVYRAADRTLTDAEVDERHAHVVAALASRFGATLRT
jgi:phenylalanyl-tRNA synthetase beta chain